MKFIIKHEIKGRIRIRLARKFHTVREADVLEQYLLGLDGVTAAKVYERTADAVIYYKEDREAVLVQVAAFDGQITEKQEMAVKSSGRALNQEYKEKLIHALNPDDDTMNFTKYEGKADSEGTDPLCDEDISPGAGPCGIHVRAGDPLYRERYPLPRI